MNCDMFCYLNIWCSSSKANDNAARKMDAADDDNVMLLRKMDAMEAELKKLKQEQKKLVKMMRCRDKKDMIAVVVLLVMVAMLPVFFSFK
jgi:hypothetical protein